MQRLPPLSLNPASHLPVTLPPSRHHSSTSPRHCALTQPTLHHGDLRDALDLPLFPSSPSSYFPPTSPPPLQPTPLRPPPSPPLSHHRYHLLPAVPISGGRGRSSPWCFPPPSIPTRTITKGKGKGKGQDWLLLHHHRPIIIIIILHLRCNYLRSKAVPQTATTKALSCSIAGIATRLPTEPHD